MISVSMGILKIYSLGSTTTIAMNIQHKGVPFVIVDFVIIKTVCFSMKQAVVIALLVLFLKPS